MAHDALRTDSYRTAQDCSCERFRNTNRRSAPFEHMRRQAPLAWDESGCVLIGDENLAGTLNDQHNKLESLRGLGRSRGRYTITNSFRIADTETTYRARVAQRPHREANQSAQLHQGLIEIRGPTCRHQPRRLRPEECFWNPFHGSMQTCREAPDITIHNRLLLVECDRADRPCGVATDAGQCSKRLKALRKLAAKLAYDLRCSPSEILRPGVIAEASPGRQHLFFRGSRQRPDVWKEFEEPLVERECGLHTGLLQHDLRDPDAVGCGVAAPRKLSPVAPVPIEKQPAKLPSFFPIPDLVEWPS